MLVVSVPSLLATCVAISAAVLTPEQLNRAVAFSTPGTFFARIGHGTVSQRSRRRARPATPKGFHLLSSASQDGAGPGNEDGGGDSKGSSAAEGGTDSLLGVQALQALEFWKNRRPSPTLPSTQVIGLLMAALQKNDEPAENDGLKTVFEFSSGMCRRAVGGNADSFIKGARNSVFGAAVGCRSFELEPMNLVGDRLATQVVSVVASDGRRRRFLWTLELQRRPPDAGKWLIYGVLSSDVDGMLMMEG